MIDVFIVGAGFAGMTAAIYATRAGYGVKIIEKYIYGGQIVQTGDIENYPGFTKIDGPSLSMKLHDQLKHLGLSVDTEELVSIEEEGNLKKIVTNKASYLAKTVIVATGSKERELGLPNEEKLKARGISYCATCDGNFYKGKELAVVGGRNTAIMSALELARVATKVYLLVRADQLKGDKTNIDKVLANPKIEVKYNTTVSKIYGDNHLESINILENGEEKPLAIAAMFLAIGSIPNTEMFKNYLALDDYNYIIADESTKTSVPGVFVAGDCRTKTVRQLTTAASDGTIAALEAANYIDNSF